ncbi:MAG: two-component system response regulator AdeR [Haloarculaceae archaeon]|jgi:two-component system response regulator AdeR
MSDSDPVVLTIEDEPEIIDTYELWLEDDYEILAAQDGEKGLELLDDSVDIVLLDRMMPKLSGEEVLEQIRSRNLDCCVAIVSAVDPDFDILEMGFDAYLPKPVTSEELHKTITNLLDRSEYNDLRQEYYALVEKRATLEATKSRPELANSEQYERLKADIDRLRDELTETAGDVGDDEEFIATIREFGDADDY